MDRGPGSDVTLVWHHRFQCGYSWLTESGPELLSDFSLSVRLHGANPSLVWDTVISSRVMPGMYSWLQLVGSGICGIMHFPVLQQSAKPHTQPRMLAVFLQRKVGLAEDTDCLGKCYGVSFSPPSTHKVTWSSSMSINLAVKLDNAAALGENRML